MRPRPMVLDAATSAELVVSLGALADPVWSAVFTGAPTDAARCPSDLRETAERLGRYALFSLLEPGVGRDASGLLSWLEAQDARELHHRLLGGRRRQLDVGPEDLDAAVAGRPAALEAALAGTVLTVTPWLLGTPSAQVKDVLLDALLRWRDLRLPPAAEEELAASLAAAVRELASLHDPADPQATLDRAAQGLRYDPPGRPRDLVLVAAPAVHPVVAVVDDVARHVVAFSPSAPGSPRDRLVALGKALGDDTRVALLELVREAPRTTSELSDAVGVPRTSLLHHLAILRSAGLLTTAVQGSSTVYRWRPEALRDLSDAAQGTLGTTVEFSRHLL